MGAPGHTAPTAPLSPHPGDGDVPGAAVTVQGHLSPGHSASGQRCPTLQVASCLGMWGQLEGTLRALSPPPQCWVLSLASFLTSQ